MLKRHNGFTIVELLIVIVVIGILAAITIIAFNGVARKATDVVLKNDASNLATNLGSYLVTNNDQYVGWFSGNPAPAGTNFKVSGDNYADIATSADQKQYCIRVFNAKSSYTSAASAYTLEQPVGACAQLTASDNAIAAVPPTSGWRSMSDHCGIRYDGKGYCWGDNSAGGLGNGTNVNSNNPTPITMSGVLAGKTFNSISGTCAIASDNNAYCWGTGGYGSLGNGTTSNSNVPVAVSTSGVLLGKTIKSLSSSGSTTCVIASDNNAYCWGYNFAGGVGDGTTNNITSPVAVINTGVLSGKTINSISVGFYQTCAIASDNNAYCWGDNNFGTLGNGNTNSYTGPVAVQTSGALAGKTLKSLSVSSLRAACAIASDSNAYCWGFNGYTALGNGTSTNSSVPLPVTATGALAGKTVKSIASASSSFCVIASDSNGYCWGDNTYGGLANGTTASNSNVPVSILNSGMLGGKSLKAIGGGGSTVCSIASDDTAYCWGNTGAGQNFGNSSMYVTASGNSYANQPVLVPQP